MDEEFEKIVLKEKEKSFHISRIPKQTKEEIIQLAHEEFCDDYGMTLKHVWDNFKLWKVFFENMDMKLNYILELLTQDEKKPEKETITMLSGRKVEKVKGGKK